MLAKSTVDDRLQCLASFASDVDCAPTALKFRGEVEFRMLLQQLLQKLHGPWITRIGLRRFHETLRGFFEPTLLAQCDAEVLEGVGALWIDASCGTTEFFTFLKPAKRVE